jgi:hypothetical protein
MVEIRDFHDVISLELLNQLLGVHRCASHHSQSATFDKVSHRGRLRPAQGVDNLFVSGAAGNFRRSGMAGRECVQQCWVYRLVDALRRLPQARRVEPVVHVRCRIRVPCLLQQLIAFGTRRQGFASRRSRADSAASRSSREKVCLKRRRRSVTRCYSFN